MKTIRCRNCSTNFPAPTRRGRPPVACDDCRAKRQAPSQTSNASDRMAKVRAARTVVVEDMEVLSKKDANPSRTHIPKGIQAQCPICYRVFSSDSLCETHKPYSIPKTKECKDPSDLGLIPVKKNNIPVWFRPQ